MAGSHTAQLNAIIDELHALGLVDAKFRSAKGNHDVCRDMKALTVQLQSPAASGPAAALADRGGGPELPLHPGAPAGAPG